MLVMQVILKFIGLLLPVILAKILFPIHPCDVPAFGLYFQFIDFPLTEKSAYMQSASYFHCD